MRLKYKDEQLFASFRALLSEDIQICKVMIHIN